VHSLPEDSQEQMFNLRRNAGWKNGDREAGKERTMTHEQIIAVEAFAKGLKDCYNSRKKSCKDNSVDKVALLTLTYATDIIDLHLQLAELKFDELAQDMAVKNG